MKTSVLEVLADDGTPLHVRCHQPLRPADRTLLLAHGASEHGGRYTHVARFLTEKGWNVVLPDHRGHGRSGGTPMYVPDFDEYARDLETVRESLGLVPSCTAVAGHSMGGLVAIRHQQCYHGRNVALAILSPLLGIRVAIPSWKLALGHAVRWVHPLYAFESDIKIEETTRGEAAIERRKNDPLMHHHVTAGWFFAVREAMLRAWKDAEKIDLPVLAMQAAEEFVVDPDVVEPWLETVASQDRTFRLFEGMYHELHNEPEWVENVTYLHDWLDARLPAGPAAEAPDFTACIAACRARTAERRHEVDVAEPEETVVAETAVAG